MEIIRNILILVLESSISRNMRKSFLRKYKNMFREKFWGWGRKVRLVPLYITTASKVAFCSRFLQITYSTSANLIINCKSRTLKSIVILFGTYSWTISFSVNNDVTSCVFSPRKRSDTKSANWSGFPFFFRHRRMVWLFLLSVFKLSVFMQL